MHDGLPQYVSHKIVRGLKIDGLNEKLITNPVALA